MIQLYYVYCGTERLFLALIYDLVRARAQQLGGRGGPDPQLSGGTPQLLTQRFCRGGSTVKPAERIHCIIQKKKERRNSYYYYCRYYPLFMFSIRP